MKIVIDRMIPFLEGVFEPYAEVVYLKGEDISHDDIVDALTEDRSYFETEDGVFTRVEE